MGKSSSPSTNTTTTNSTLPPQVTDAYTNVTNQAANVAAAPLSQYAGPLVSGFTPDQTSAFNTIDNVQGVSTPYTNAAAQLTAAGSAPITPQQFSAGQVNQYESPYTQQVVNATQAEFNNQNQQQASQLTGNAISAGAFGGDREAIAQSSLANQQQLAQAPQIAALENQGYNQALGEFNTQQQAGVGAQEASGYLAENAGFGLGSLGSQAQNNALTGASAQLQSGALQQQLGQEQLNVPYEEFLQQQAYPFQTTQFEAGIDEGLGNQGGSSSTTSPAPSQLATYAGLGLGGLGLLGSSGALGSTGTGNPADENYSAGSGILGALSSYARGGVTRQNRDGGGGIAGFSLPTVPDVSVSVVPNSQNNGQRGGMGIPAAPHAPQAPTPQLTAANVKSDLSLGQPWQKPAPTTGFETDTYFRGGRTGLDSGGIAGFTLSPGRDIPIPVLNAVNPDSSQLAGNSGSNLPSNLTSDYTPPPVSSLPFTTTPNTFASPTGVASATPTPVTTTAGLSPSASSSNSPGGSAGGPGGLSGTGADGVGGVAGGSTSQAAGFTPADTAGTSSSAPSGSSSSSSSGISGIAQGAHDALNSTGGQIVSGIAGLIPGVNVVSAAINAIDKGAAALGLVSSAPQAPNPADESTTDALIDSGVLNSDATTAAPGFTPADTASAASAPTPAQSSAAEIADLESMGMTVNEAQVAVENANAGFAGDGIAGYGGGGLSSADSAGFGDGAVAVGGFDDGGDGFGGGYGGSDASGNAARGGRIRGGFDQGGQIQSGLLSAGATPAAAGISPFGQSSYSQYSKMSPEQLRELAVRVPPQSPQGQALQKAIQVQQMNPTAAAQASGTAPPMAGMAPTAGMAPSLGQQPQGLTMRSGGRAGFDDGGDIDNQQISNPVTTGIENGWDFITPNAADVRAGVVNPDAGKPGYDPRIGSVPMSQRDGMVAPVQAQVPAASGQPSIADIMRANHPSYEGTSDAGTIADTLRAQGSPIVTPSTTAPSGMSGPRMMGDQPMGGMNNPGAWGTHAGTTDPDTVTARPMGPAPTDRPLSPSMIAVGPTGDTPGLGNRVGAGNAPVKTPDDTMGAVLPQGGMTIPTVTLAGDKATGVTADTNEPLGKNAPVHERSAISQMADSPWMALVSAGAGLAASKSPQFGVALGEGAEQGIKYLGTQQAADREQQQVDQTGAYQQGDLAAKQQSYVLEGKKLDQAISSAAAQHAIETQRAATEAQRAADDAKFHQGSLANSAAEIGIRQQDANKGFYEPTRPMINADGTPVVDANGVPQAIWTDRQTGRSMQAPLPDQTISGKVGATQKLAGALMLSGATPDMATALQMIRDPSGKSQQTIKIAAQRLATTEAGPGADPKDIDARARDLLSGNLSSPAPTARPTARPTASAAPPAPPPPTDDDLALLKTHPELAPQFEKIHGVGSATPYLSGP